MLSFVRGGGAKNPMNFILDWIDPHLTSRKNSLEMIELSSINKVSSV